ncbi:hypothetical protein FOZ61_006192 [Perkinsus olseni]|uniref:Uncharacterized protein n=1 Tax=Perkinsus olseni TaxID=32597 RepID=A0A7J6MC19_PEROL|nr:hypothetical protein FOZ61_006192 [Perkinsus olseni]
MIHQCDKRGTYIDDIELKFQAHENATEEVKDRLSELESDFATWNQTTVSAETAGEVVTLQLPEMGTLVEGLEIIKKTTTKLARRREHDVQQSEARFESLNARLSHVERSCCCCGDSSSDGDTCPVIEACRKLQGEIEEMTKAKVPAIESKLTSHFSETAELVGGLRTDLKQVRGDLDGLIEGSGHRAAAFKTMIDLGQQNQILQTRRDSQLSTVESELEYLKGEIRAVIEKQTQPSDTSEAVDLVRAELRNRIERLTREHRQESLDIRSQLRGLKDLRDRFSSLSEKYDSLAEGVQDRPQPSPHRSLEAADGRSSMAQEVEKLQGQVKEIRSKIHEIERSVAFLQKAPRNHGTKTTSDKWGSDGETMFGDNVESEAEGRFHERVDEQGVSVSDMPRYDSQDSLSADQQQRTTMRYEIPAKQVGEFSEYFGTITTSRSDDALTALWAMRREELCSEELRTSPTFSAFDEDFYFTAAISADGDIGLCLTGSCSTRDVTCDLFAVRADSGDVVATHTIPVPQSGGGAGTRSLCPIEEVLGDFADTNLFLGCRMRANPP